MAFCMNCGTRLSDTARFCPECGAPAESLGSGHATEQGYAPTYGPETTNEPQPADEPSYADVHRYDSEQRPTYEYEPQYKPERTYDSRSAYEPEPRTAHADEPQYEPRLIYEYDPLSALEPEAELGYTPEPVRGDLPDEEADWLLADNLPVFEDEASGGSPVTSAGPVAASPVPRPKRPTNVGTSRKPEAPAAAQATELPAQGGTAEKADSAQTGMATLSTWKQVPPVASANSAQSAASSAKMTHTEEFARRRAAERSQAASASKPKRSKLPYLLIGIGTACCLAAALAGFLLQRFQSKEPEPIDREPTTATVPATPTDDGSTADDDPPVDGGEPPVGAEPTIVDKPTASEPTASDPATSEPAASDPTPETPASTEPASEQYSTDNTPKVSEFVWFRDDMEAARPGDGATVLHDFDAVKGGWKAYIHNSPKVEGAGVLENLLNVFIAGSAQDAEVTFVWYWARNLATGDDWPTPQADTVYAGKLKDGILEASGEGVGKVHLTTFWQDGDKEYATGFINWSDGTDALIALVRP